MRREAGRNRIRFGQGPVRKVRIISSVDSMGWPSSRAGNCCHSRTSLSAVGIRSSRPRIGTRLLISPCSPTVTRKTTIGSPHCGMLGRGASGNGAIILPNSRRSGRCIDTRPGSGCKRADLRMPIATEAEAVRGSCGREMRVGELPAAGAVTRIDPAGSNGDDSGLEDCALGDSAFGDSAFGAAASSLGRGVGVVAVFELASEFSGGAGAVAAGGLLGDCAAAELSFASGVSPEFVAGFAVGFAGAAAAGSDGAGGEARPINSCKFHP